jgi:hypothetical protein
VGRDGWKDEKIKKGMDYKTQRKLKLDNQNYVYTIPDQIPDMPHTSKAA